ncbi:AMP-binding protein [Mycobacterium shinjukuense]|uniref:Long-chain-fatty-acid--AMP ligase FadD28 n=1 Tax=Mycobacterium shinjukuense TaxID=398694 RepID=A0A7I7MLU2_9MYCO|nr:fatty-acid--AMP ligase FAAL28/FadD28 [Mycobacterium shinjukuense]MCV6985977.1 AMP-binding protein [Mycobacterium shinjukuense]ORB70509.1 acyl-CoA synthetase [Mycobacterium shinjukuense]BBX72820.1 long-chain-fatty-acid--AMP ligase FadD28 [Mycobacterium shinjukuense]
MTVRSLPAVLRAWARLQPNETAFTFIDYEQDWDGVAESLTWAQLYRRTRNVARELRRCGSTGERAAIVAPQGLDYIVGFLGALQAGLVAVPLSVPQGGASDDRVDAVLRDASPVAVLTTSSVIDDVAQHVTRQPGESAASIIEVDSLDLDSPNGSDAGDENYPATAYLQYTSGSTRTPAGVMMSHQNLRSNFEQLMSGYFADSDGIAPPDATLVSWLPFYHDMGLVLGICAPILGGYRAALTSPVAFLQRPARWMHLLAGHSHPFSAAPNFAFELAAKKITDDDMAGHDLGAVLTILSGSERVQPATLQRFADRFARFNLQEKVLRPSYGLAEATVYVATSRPGQPPTLVDFETEKLSAGHAQRCATGRGTRLVSYLVPQSPIVRIVDPETRTERPQGMVGEIWVHGDNVATGYWRRPEETKRTFGATIVAPSAGTPEGPWLRTGDSGFVDDGELFIIGRIKDLLIVYGRNHSPDDIEATIQEITRGRCAAISVPGDRSTERLVAIIELKKRGDSDEAATERLSAIKREVTSALASSHGLSVADLVLVPPGSIPITTSGKVRRGACVEQYRQDQFARLDA